jgi:hypothetical protein
VIPFEPVRAEYGEIIVPEPGDLEAARLPPGWDAVATGADPAARCAAALSRWTQGIRDLLPRFTQELSSRLTDVRLTSIKGEWALRYIAPGVDWIGRQPEVAERPVFWETLPEPVREFLDTVHSGFTAPDGESYGFMRPAYMLTYAAMAGFDGPIPGWDDEDDPDRILSTRLMQVTNDGGLLSYCTSPDLPHGSVALIYEGDIDPKDFGSEFDELLTERLTDEYPPCLGA